jgi:hypothetical protein
MFAVLDLVDCCSQITPHHLSLNGKPIIGSMPKRFYLFILDNFLS